MRELQLALLAVLYRLPLSVCVSFLMNFDERKVTYLFVRFSYTAIADKHVY